MATSETRVPSLHHHLDILLKMFSTQEAICFSELLVKFCLEKQGLHWAPDHAFEVIDDSVLAAHDVGTAVLDLARQAQDMVADCKTELEESDCTSPKEFTRCALAAARYYFPKGYTPVTFLSYCAMVVGVTCMFYREGNHLLAVCSAEVIGLVIVAHVLTKKFEENGGYGRLREVSILYSNSLLQTLQKKKKKKSL